MRSAPILLTLFLTVSAFAQSDRGSLTGTVADPTGAVIPAARIVLLHVDTGTNYETVSTETGNYTLPSLPVGAYKLSVEHPGFNRHEQTGIRIQVAVTARLDIELRVGQVTESVEVTSGVAMLKTESAELSTTVTGDTLNALPINFGIGAGAIRNPLSFVQLTPGATMNGWNNIRVNGTPAGSFRIVFEGQESSSGLDTRVSDELQPSVDAIQEFTLQTSNFAAEFGLVAGGLFNFTSKSGTNQFHGGGYDYFVNEFLNAGIPFTDNGHGGHVRAPKRLNDFGFTVGGPAIIPKLYNGKNKTFFFWSLERYVDIENRYLGLTTVPTDAYRGGDLSAMLTKRNLGTDFAGRPILENTIYDPSNYRIDASGRLIREPFANNFIAPNLFDSVSKKILAYLPKPTINSLVNNYELRFPHFQKIQTIPSIKIDHNFTGTAKISGYWSMQETDKDNSVNGLPDPITGRIFEYIRSDTARINFDKSLTPTLILHLGVGWQRYRDPETPASRDFDAAGQLGLKGTLGTGFPSIGSLGNSTYGGMSSSIGHGVGDLYFVYKPTAVVQLTYVHGNHTYKTGGEWKVDTQTNRNYIPTSPSLSFSSAVTGQPLYGSTTLPGGTAIGSNFATFLLGLYDGGSIGNATDPQYRKSSWAFYVQDTWKVTRRLTLDYGIRYDLQKPMRELHARTSTFNASVSNPNANGLLGGTLYEGSGAGRCNCTLVSTYPYAIAPRIGLAYKLWEKTVLRAGWGFSFNQTNQFNYIGAANSQGMGFNTINFVPPGTALPVGSLSDGLSYSLSALYAASYDPGLRVVPGVSVQSSPATVDPNGGRPPRVNQWNISLQHEVMKDLVVEGAYVGNRGVWFMNSNLINYNAINPDLYKNLKIDLTNSADRTLLSGAITSPVAVNRGFKKPYANFPDSGTVVQSLKPYPQFSSIGSLWAPLGRTWYDAFQAKVTKRYSYGLDYSLSYAFSKTLSNSDGTGNIFDRASFKSLSSADLPHILTMAINYRLPSYGLANRNRLTRTLLADWTIGSVLQYLSGPLLAAPASNNGIGTYLPGQSTRQFRVAGQPLYLKDLNGGFDPTKETVLNPAAWTDQATGVWGSAIAYYRDFRGMRRPNESMSLGKRFRIRGERMALSLRVELFNVFNRLEGLPNPSTSNPATAPTKNPTTGVLTGGFGFVNYNSISSTDNTPRNGQLVARFEF